MALSCARICGASHRCERQATPPKLKGMIMENTSSTTLFRMTVVGLLISTILAYFIFQQVNSVKKSTMAMQGAVMQGASPPGNNHRWLLDANTSTENGYGYVLVSLYHDQTTGATRHILSLQNWASSISERVRVVEPFLHHGSFLGFSMTEENPNENLVRLGDLFDLDYWDNVTKFAPLIRWEEFLISAPKNLILVSHKCKDGTKFLWCNDFKTSAMAFAKEHDFKIVRQVCYDNERYSKKDFESFIYGRFQPHNSVVLFSHWGGVGTVKYNSYQISGLDKIDVHAMSLLLRNSASILNDSRHYLESYMPGASRTGYVSVMFRIEMFFAHHKFSEIKSKDEKISLLKNCVTSLRRRISMLKLQHKTESVFLAMDCRKYGSYGFKKPSKYLTQLATKELVKTISVMIYEALYEKSSSLEDWDESFERVSSFKSPGYVAQLQKSLAAHGACLVTAGGGNFQKSAITLYKSMQHKNECIFEVPECS